MQAHLKLVQPSEPAYTMNLNFLEYPIYLPTKKPETDSYIIKKTTFEDRELTQEFELVPGSYGTPTSEDYKILAVLLHLAQDKKTQNYKFEMVFI